ncbi:MAG: PAS domain S-box protein [Rhodospirillales bacterium]|nr:PAS domain S-box protein [Rhodospirillales bacterium]
MRKKLYAAHPFIITVVSVLLSLMVFVGVQDWERNHLRQRFETTANTYQALLEEKLLFYLNELDATTRFVAGSKFVNRFEFQTFVDKPMSRAKEVSAIFWAPRITNVMRPKLEGSLWIRGLAGRGIYGKDLSPDGRYEIPVREGRINFPVLYAEPIDVHDSLIGFDLMSDMSLRTLLELSRDDNTVIPITGSNGARLLHKGKITLPTNINFIQPVYRSGLSLKTIRQRRENHLGFVILQFDIGLAIEGAVSAIPPSGTDMYIVDVEGKSGEEVVYFHASGLGETTKSLPYEELWKPRDPVSISNVKIPGRQWKLIMLPDTTYFEQNQSYLSRSIFLFGLILSGMLSILLFTNARRTGYIENIISQRTHELENSETRIRAIIENVAEGVVTIDEHGIIETFNPASEKMFDYAAADVIGKNVNVLVPEHERHDHDQYIAASALVTPRIINKSRELFGRRINGDLFPLELTVSRMVLNGEPKFIGIMHDISDRKVTEDATRQAREQAEASSRAKSELLANMSHELRTPLNAIIGFSDTIISEIFGPINNNRYMVYLNDIHHSGLHLLELINDILDVSAIEAGAIDLHESNLRVADVVESSIRIIAARAEKGQVCIEVSTEPKSLQVYADERRLKQILLNLLSDVRPESSSILK